MRLLKASLGFNPLPIPSICKKDCELSGVKMPNFCPTHVKPVSVNAIHTQKQCDFSGRGVPNDHDDDTWMIPWGRPKFVALGLKMYWETVVPLSESGKKNWNPELGDPDQNPKLSFFPSALRSLLWYPYSTALFIWSQVIFTFRSLTKLIGPERPWRKRNRCDERLCGKHIPGHAFPLLGSLSQQNANVKVNQCPRPMKVRHKCVKLRGFCSSGGRNTHGRALSWLQHSHLAFQ